LIKQFFGFGKTVDWRLL